MLKGVFMRLKNFLFTIFILFIISFAFTQDIIVKPVNGLSQDFIKGVDISMLAQIEEKGGKYYDFDGKSKDLITILKDNGVNWIRLRLWVDPINHLPVIEGEKIISNKGSKVGGGNCDLNTVIALSKRVKGAGLKLLLDIHYSDFWADPGKQTKPWEWRNYNEDKLSKEIYIYTKDVLLKLKKSGIIPEMVQIGNELNNGMLWPEGKIWATSSDEKVGGMKSFIKLLKKASKAVREIAPKTKIAIHLADGGNNSLYREIFDPITEQGVDFDIIGLSYYPYWHGPMSDLSYNLKDLSSRYKKELVIMETAYGYTTEDGDSQGNVFKVYNDEIGGYLPTIQGQATVVRDVFSTIANVDGGLGVFYWEPDWIPVPGAGWRTGEGSNWENQAMFDFEGKVLPSIKVFKGIYGNDVNINAISTKDLKITTVIGEELKLPQKAEAIFSDGTWRYEDVTWDTSGLIPLNSPGKVSIVGYLNNFNLISNLEITYTNVKNIVKNNSFETGNDDGWILSDPSHAATIEDNSSNALTGNWSYKYWKDKAFKTVLMQNFSNIQNGNYTLKCRAMGGGGENSIYLFAKDFGKEEIALVSIENKGWKIWKEYILTGIEVTNNKATIGLSIDAQSGNWANYDDFEFYLDK